MTTAADAPHPVYMLTGADGRTYRSTEPGTVGGYRRRRLYGRLDCPSAVRAIARGHYIEYRVFFADETTAIAAGYRPCAVCLPEKYIGWKAARDTASGSATGEPRRAALRDAGWAGS
ncbi:hypothetical protein ABIA39_001605 [Nocardia sp. GAS34]|uniref:Ada metal-binding domain-containing protein n=1 Tax=unclassified Nocardia TaxID=2637762 RepID=UPI003D1E3D1D